MAARWSDDNEAILRELWQQRHSASHIAKALGAGFTRNMVIGKAHRLGLESRPSPIVRTSPGEYGRNADALRRLDAGEFDR